MSEQEFANQFVKFFNQHNGIDHEWYVGIASNPEIRLFHEHNVDKNNDPWIYDNAGSDIVARRIENYLLRVLKCKGGVGGGDSSTTSVYLYKTSYHTVE